MEYLLAQQTICCPLAQMPAAPSALLLAAAQEQGLEKMVVCPGGFTGVQE